MAQELKKDTQTLNHTVEKNKNVFLTVIVGNNQYGSSKVYFSNDDSNILIKGDVENYNLGRGNTLVSKELIVKTTVLDSNENTNKISISILLNDMRYDYENFVDHNHDAFRLTTKINFL
ncbi:MAG: hypothetical protein R2831_01685 [Chitinophagaceae bacterium]